MYVTTYLVLYMCAAAARAAPHEVPLEICQICNDEM